MDQRDKFYYWMGLIQGIGCTMAIGLLIGGLDAAGKLDPILDFLGISK